MQGLYAGVLVFLLNREKGCFKRKAYKMNKYMKKISVDYVPVNSEKNGDYTLLKLKEVSAKEIRSDYELIASLEENFGKRFVIVETSPEGMTDFVLNEHTVGIPTPEFESRLSSAEWQTKQINVDA